MSRILLCCFYICLLTVFSFHSHAESDKKYLAIIIDDVGNNLPLGRRAVELPGAITYAILPHTPAAKKLAFYTTQVNAKKEVIVHMPMESVEERRLGPGGLTTDIDKQIFVDTVKTALQEVPFAKGLSNHMGSYLTTLPDRMHWLMTELNRQGLYYIDSKTTAASVAEQAAYDSQVPFLARDTFLDHNPDPTAISEAFSKALATAQKTGLAVVVAHPYRSTLTFLERELPKLSGHNIELIRASDAILLRNQQHKLAAKESHNTPQGADAKYY